ncbi:MAG: beta-lactamase family protein [bacterium]|nr:beta-lactamase family protein [bacterium]
MKHIIKRLISICAFPALMHSFLIPPVYPSETQSPKQTIKRLDGTVVPVSKLDQTIPQLLKKVKVPGISIAVVNDSQIVYTGAFGVKNTVTGEPVSRDTIFEAASLSKPALAYTVLKLVDEGKIDLDKPLVQYMPNQDIANFQYKHLPYKDIANDPRHKLITTRIALKHASGFPNWRWENKDKKLDIKFTPGEKFNYSGEGYFYLQRVVETIMGKGFEEIARENIFIPLKMASSSLTYGDLTAHATGHSKDLKPVKKRLTKNVVSALSLHTTATDYARFLLALLNGISLSKKSAAEMFTPQIPISQSNKYNTLSWGLGWGLEKIKGDTFFWQWGDNGAFKSYVVVSLTKKTGVVFFTNGYNGLKLTDLIVELTLGGKYSIYSWLKGD